MGKLSEARLKSQSLDIIYARRGYRYNLFGYHIRAKRLQVQFVWISYTREEATGTICLNLIYARRGYRYNLFGQSIQGPVDYGLVVPMDTRDTRLVDGRFE